MKKLFTLLALFALLFASCSDDDDDNNFIPELEVDTQSIDYLFEGNTYAFNILTNTKWTASTDADWIKLSETSGDGNATVLVFANTNKKSEKLSGKITVKVTGIDDAVINLTQQKKPESTVGLYILSEGQMGKNQAEIAYYDIQSDALSKKIFEERNKVKLGDIGNDLAIYGSKMYCVVTGTTVEDGGGHIEIINPSTGISIKRIPFKGADGKADLPRRIAFYKDKAYVTAFSGIVARLDTASLSIDGYAELSETGTEGITQYGGNFYACNSGKGTGKTISVIDIASFKETKTITVPENPISIRATPTGELYFSTALVGTTIPSNFHSLDLKSNKITTYNINASKVAIDKEYIYTIDYSSMGDTYNSKINIETKEISNFTSEMPAYFMGYGVNTNPLDGNIYTLGFGQDVAIFDKDGKLLKKLKTGTGWGSTVVPVYK